MEVGRELDVLIANKVMHWKCAQEFHEFTSFDFSTGEIEHSGLSERCWNFGKDCDSHRPDFSTDIAAAWPIAEKFKFIVGPEYSGGFNPKHIGWSVYLDWFSVHDDVYDDPGSERALAIAQTAAHAICLAALKLVEAKNLK